VLDMLVFIALSELILPLAGLFYDQADTCKLKRTEGRPGS
jgi:hypothetical protein